MFIPSHMLAKTAEDGTDTEGTEHRFLRDLDTGRVYKLQHRIGESLADMIPWSLKLGRRRENEGSCLSSWANPFGKYEEVKMEKKGE